MQISKGSRLSILSKLDNMGDRYIVAAALAMMNDVIETNADKVFGEYGTLLAEVIGDKNESTESADVARL